MGISHPKHGDPLNSGTTPADRDIAGHRDHDFLRVVGAELRPALDRTIQRGVDEGWLELADKIESYRDAVWRQIISAPVLLSKLTGKYVFFKYPRDTEKHSQACLFEERETREAISRAVVENDSPCTGLVEGQQADDPRTILERYRECLSTVGLTDGETSLLIEEAWRLHSFAIELWPKSPDQYLSMVSRIVSGPVPEEGGLRLDRFTCNVFTIVHFSVMRSLLVPEDSPMVGISTSLRDCMLERVTAAECETTNGRFPFVEEFRETIRDIMCAVSLQLPPGHAWLFPATLWHRTQLFFEKASTPEFTGRVLKKRSLAEQGQLLLEECASPMLRPYSSSTVIEPLGERDARAEVGRCNNNSLHPHSYPEWKELWVAVQSGSIVASDRFEEEAEKWDGTCGRWKVLQDLAKSMVEFALRHLPRALDRWPGLSEGLERSRSCFYDIQEIFTDVVDDWNETRRTEQQLLRSARRDNQLKRGREMAELEEIQTGRTTQRERNRARQQQSDHLERFYQRYQEPRITGSSAEALSRVEKHCATGSQAQQLQFVREAISYLRTTLLDRRGVLTADSEKAGDLFVDQLANLLFDPKNIGAVLKACDFEDLAKFQNPVAISHSTPDRSNLGTLGFLYNRSESVGVAVEAILNNDHRGSLLFIGGLTLSVPDLKKLRAAKAGEVAGYIDRIRGVLRGEERVASVKTKTVLHSTTAKAAKVELPVLPTGFWDQTGQDAKQWAQTPNDTGSISLTRIEDGVSLTIPKKKLKTLRDAAVHFENNIGKAERQRNLDLLLQGLESEGFVVTQTEAITTVRHVGAAEEITVGLDPDEAFGKIFKFVKKCEPYRTELDAMHNLAGERGVALTFVNDESGCRAVVCDRTIPIQSLYPTHEEMREICQAIQESSEHKVFEETRRVRLEQLCKDAEALLPSAGNPSIILDATVLINFSAVLGDGRMLPLLNLVGKSGARMYVPATVFFECTGMVPTLQDGELVMERVLRFSLSSDIRKLLHRAPIISFAETGSEVRVVGCANLNGGIDPEFIIVEGPQDREHFRRVLRQRAAYARHTKEGGTLADSLRNVGLLEGGAGDRSISEFYRTMIARRGRGAMEGVPKMIICSDDLSLWSGDASTFGTRDLISYIYAYNQPSLIASQLGRSGQLVEQELVDIMVAGRPKHYKRFMHRYHNLQHRRHGEETILRFFEGSTGR